jgi:DNA repair photolyase
MAKKINNDIVKVGITETSDPFMHLEIFDKLFEANIIITKRLTDKLIEKLIEHKSKCILHITCTGLGSTKLEPLVPTTQETYTKFNKLIEGGFPVEQVVLRIDPIIPTNKGIKTALNVIKTFKDSGITRIRYSCMDMYEHVKTRFIKENMPLPYDTFHADQKLINGVMNSIHASAYVLGAEAEACGEPGIKSIGCISQKDIDILGLTDKIKLEGNSDQRKGCLCPSNKQQLIKCKPAPCENSCLYCFWQN